MIFGPFWEVGGCKSERIVGHVEEHPGDQAAGLNRDVADEEPEHDCGQRLLNDAMHEPEENGGEADCPPLAAEMAKAGEDETAKGKFFAEGG